MKKRVQKKSKKLLLELDQVSTSFFEIARHFEELFKLTNDTSGKIMKSNRLDGLKDIYVSLNNMMVSWGNSLVKQTNYLQENMNYFLKYQSKQTASFQEVFLL